MYKHYTKAIEHIAERYLVEKEDIEILCISSVEHNFDGLRGRAITWRAKNTKYIEDILPA